MAETLLSVVSQFAVVPVEIIVVDDGSVDGSLSVLRGFPRVHVHQQEHLGVAAARNKGVAVAGGEYIAFCDSDDLMLPGRIAAQHAFLEENVEAVGVAGNYLNFNTSSGVNPLMRFDHRKFGILPGQSGIVLNYAKAGASVGNPFVSSGMFRRSALEAVGGFSESLRRCEDFHLVAKLMTKGSLGIIDRPMMLVRGDGHPRLTAIQGDSNPYEEMVDVFLKEDVRLFKENDIFRGHVRMWAGRVVLREFREGRLLELLRLLRKYRHLLRVGDIAKAQVAIALLKANGVRGLRDG